MSQAKIEAPPYRVAAAMLRTTTERLAREVANPSDSAPQWSETEWVIARAASSMQGISALLADRLRWSGPDLWESFLDEQRDQSRLRHFAADALLARLDEAFREAGCGALALKGSAIRKLGVYSAGARPMGDVDLLIRPTDRVAVDAVLRALDFNLILRKDRHDIYAPRSISATNFVGEHASNPLKIELHSRVAEALPLRSVDITRHLPASGADLGLQDYRSLAALLLHVTLHAAGNMRAHAARQIQFNDIAVLAPRLGTADWAEYLREPESGRPRWWLYPPLALANRYYPGSLPAEVLDEAHAACPRRLRRWVGRSSLTDISWSNLRISAFPGIAWSRSLPEAVRFACRRLVPARPELDELRQWAAHEKRLTMVAWYELSHVNRILRWVVSKPPRVQSMSSILAQIGHVNLHR